jgi:hypothetical protein
MKTFVAIGKSQHGWQTPKVIEASHEAEAAITYDDPRTAEAPLEVWVCELSRGVLCGSPAWEAYRIEQDPRPPTPPLRAVLLPLLSVME